MVYIIPVFLPNAIWLGLAQVFQDTFQFLAHGIAVNLKLKSSYNPGLGAVMFLQMLIGIYYIRQVTTIHLASTCDFVFRMIGFIVVAVLLFLLPLRWIVGNN